jgi:ubiquinone/menaquinone biosynthesis C-methylase UbiE
VVLAARGLSAETRGDDVDVNAVFGSDYLFFHPVDRARSAADGATVARILGLAAGSSVLDLACGEGRLARALANLGCQVVGIDMSESMLEQAVLAGGEGVRYRSEDMRLLMDEAVFDHAFSWFTSLTYFEDDVIVDILQRVRRALKPDGRFAMEMIHRDWLTRNISEQTVVERGDCFLIDRHRFTSVDGRVHTERTVVRNGVRRCKFYVRLPAATEVREWFRNAGFGEVHLLDGSGGPFATESSRIIVVGRAC